MNKKNTLLILLTAALLATGLYIRSIDFTRLAVSHLVPMAIFAALNGLLWYLWKRAGGE